MKKYIKNMLSGSNEASSKRLQSFMYVFATIGLAITFCIWGIIKGINPSYIVEVILGLGALGAGLQIVSKIKERLK